MRLSLVHDPFDENNDAVGCSGLKVLSWGEGGVGQNDWEKLTGSHVLPP